MKKIINGKKYDTNTAECVGEFENSCNRGDFNFVRELLYKKKTGEFFIYGYGGANSKWQESCGQNSRSSGEGIEPLTIDEAKTWVENFDCEEYENLFGVCPE